MNAAPLLRAAAVHRDLMARGVTPVLHDSFPAGDVVPAGGEHTCPDVEVGGGAHTSLPNVAPPRPAAVPAVRAD